MKRLRQGSFREQLSGIIQPSDLVNISFVTLLLLLTLLFSDRVINPRMLGALYSGMLLTSFSLVWFVRSDSRPVLYFLRKWYPVAFVVLSFFSLGSIVHYILPYDIDAKLIDIDLYLFGNHPTVLLSRFMNPYLVDLLEISYASFYFLPVVVGLALYLKGKWRDFEVFATIVCLGFYLSDLGNVLFPARGPSQTLVMLHTVPLEGKWVGGFIRTLLYVLEPYRWDCFPSGHVCVTLLTLALGYRFERRVFWWILPIATALIFSTVYLRYHYVIDLLAGALVAGAILAGSGVMEWVAVKFRKLARLRLQIYSVDKDIS